MFKIKQGNFNRESFARRKSFAERKLGIFGKLGIEKIGQGNKLRTRQTDTDYQARSFEGRMKSVRAGIAGKHKLGNFSDEDIDKTKNVIEPILKKHVSKRKASLSIAEAREVNRAFYNMYKNDKNFSEQDYLGAKKIVGILRNNEKSLLLRNKKKTNDLEPEKSNLSKKMIAENSINKEINDLNVNSHIRSKVGVTIPEKENSVELNEKIDMEKEVDEEFDLEALITQEQDLKEDSGVEDLPI